MAAGAGGPPPPPGAGGGPNLKVIGIGAGIVIALLLVAVVAASFLGGLGPTATPTHAANLSPTPTSGASASGASPSGSGAVSSPTASASAGLPTDTPTASAPGPTDTPVTPTSGPTATPRPTRTPRPTSNATPAPADARCTNVGNRGRFTTGFVPGSSRTLDAHTAWCVKSVTFAKGNGSGTLKIFLVNDAFDVSPYGWAEVQQPDGFGGSDTYKWDFSIGLPQGYDNIPPNTQIQFQTTNHASGNVFITYVVVHVP